MVAVQTTPIITEKKWPTTNDTNSTKATASERLDLSAQSARIQAILNHFQQVRYVGESGGLTMNGKLSNINPYLVSE
jgi:hypothetical protein